MDIKNLEDSKLEEVVDSLEYDIKLCIEVVNYCVFHNPKTADMTVGELRKKIDGLFPEDVIEKALEIMTK